MRVTDTLFIDEAYLEERFVRSSGPGGQHVNKTSSAVQLRFDIGRCDSLEDRIKTRLRKLAGSRLTKDDVLIIQSDASRSQARNRELARDQLAGLIKAALKTRKPRRKTRPSLSSIRKQKEAKRQQAIKKSLRRSPRPED